MSLANYSKQLQSDIAKYVRDPLGFTKYAYPWGEKELHDSFGPRKWQTDILASIRDHLQNPATQFTPFQCAIASGHGIGKSALLAFICEWGMATCPDCKIIVTAGTGTQLDTKTVPEVTKWFHLSLLKSWFDTKATSITIKLEDRAKLWRTDFITWSENNAQAFAGAHNKGNRIIIIFDEASTISDKIWETTEGALTDENTEILWFACSQPTVNTGRFRECFGSLKHRWKGFQIDSRTIEGVNKEQINKWVEDYGEDDDFVRIRVRGEFPRRGSSQLISSESVALARKYKAQGYATLPKVLSCDVARYGDDQTVIGWRQGRYSEIIAKLRGLSNVQVAERIIEQIEAAKQINEPYDAWVIDGDGLGAGVVDMLEHRGYTSGLFDFHGGSSAQDVNAYYNRRAECWALMGKWLEAGAQIPDDPELATDLTGPEYGFSGKDQIQLERKKDMKIRGLSSPDCGDMLAMTFSVRLAARKTEHKHEYVYAGQNDAAWMQ